MFVCHNKISAHSNKISNVRYKLHNFCPKVINSAIPSQGTKIKQTNKINHQ